MFIIHPRVAQKREKRKKIDRGVIHEEFSIIKPGIKLNQKMEKFKRLE